MPALVDLTATLGLKIRHENLYLEGQSSGPAPGLDGREQVVFTENRVWRGSIQLPPMTGADLALLRVSGTRARGRAVRLRLPVLNLFSPIYHGDDAAFWRSLGIAETDIAAGYQHFGDGFGFSDGTGFALPDGSDPVTLEPLAAGATALTLEGFMARSLAVGDRFSINGFLYEVDSNDAGALIFAPPLREAVAAGTTVKVSTPDIIMRLTSDDGWRPFIELGHASREMTIDLIEAFER